MNSRHILLLPIGCLITVTVGFHAYAAAGPGVLLHNGPPGWAASDVPSPGNELSHRLLSKPPPDAQHQVAKTFQQYRAAVLSNDGEAAWHIVDAGTKEFYSQCLEQALTLPKADVNRLQLLQRLYVLRLRHEFRKSALQQMNGEKVFALAVKNGWIDKSTVQDFGSTDNLVVEEPRARIYLPKDSKRTAPLLHFVREGGHWKLALWKSFPLANASLSYMLRDMNLSEDAFIQGALTYTSQFAFDERIYDGPLD